MRVALTVMLTLPADKAKAIWEAVEKAQVALADVQGIVPWRIIGIVRRRAERRVAFDS